MSDIKVGDTVVATSEVYHRISPTTYPDVGTKGIILGVESDGEIYRVQWEVGSTSDNDIWLAEAKSVKLCGYFDVGDYVVFTDKGAHITLPQYYPEPGTRGQIIANLITLKDNEIGFKNYELFKIQWESGSTSGNDRWYARPDQFDKFEGQELPNLDFVDMYSILFI